MAEAGGREKTGEFGGRMRLTCPNCKAQYEIDGTAIPETGRDVQCSACATTWYQYPETAQPASETLSPDEGAVGDEATPPSNRAAAPRVDQSVLDVLREEAERELTERRRNNAGGLETQGDLGLVTRPRDAAPAPRPAVEEPATEAPAPSRRNLLPDIEELSSTLQPGSTPRRTGSTETSLPPTADDERSGFRQGLSLMLLVGMLLVGLYVLAPLIARHVPALAEPMAGYVALADSLRAWVAESLRGLAARIAAMG